MVPYRLDLLDCLLDVQPLLDHEVRRDEGRRTGDACLAMNEYALFFLEDRVDEVDAGEEVLDDVGLLRIVDVDTVDLDARVSGVVLAHWREEERSANG